MVVFYPLEDPRVLLPRLLLHKFVVISSDQILPALQPAQHLIGGVWSSHGHVTEDVNIIVWHDRAVPVPDQGLVHFVHIAKWTPGMADNILVVKMQIARKIDQYLTSFDIATGKFLTFPLISIPYDKSSYMIPHRPLLSLS